MYMLTPIHVIVPFCLRSSGSRSGKLAVPRWKPVESNESGWCGTAAPKVSWESLEASCCFRDWSGITIQAVTKFQADQRWIVSDHRWTERFIIEEFQEEVRWNDSELEQRKWSFEWSAYRRMSLCLMIQVINRNIVESKRHNCICHQIITYLWSLAGLRWSWRSRRAACPRGCRRWRRCRQHLGSGFDEAFGDFKLPTSQGCFETYGVRFKETLGKKRGGVSIQLGGRLWRSASQLREAEQLCLLHAFPPHTWTGNHPSRRNCCRVEEWCTKGNQTKTWFWICRWKLSSQTSCYFGVVLGVLTVI